VDEKFRPLASLLREAREASVHRSIGVMAVRAEAPAPPQSEDRSLRVDAVGLCNEIALARAAVIEAFERVRFRLLERLARDVLSRELALAPVDIAALARRVLAEFSDDEPVALVVAPADASHVNCDVPVRVDVSLSPGDLVVAVRDGVIDARFALRARRCLREIAA
jgi:hypothetical protein